MSRETYDLPTSWVWATISKVATIVTGNTPSKSDKLNYGDYLPWVKPPQLDLEGPITDTPEKLSKKGAKLARVLPKDSILVSCIGLLGKIGLAGCELATNQQINSLIFQDIILPKYGYYYCKSKYFKDWLHAKASATTVSILNKGRFSEAPIPVPPFREQKRIIKKIETLLERLDKAKQELAKIPPLLKKFRQSVLAKAFSGELTKEWREQQKDLEPASALLERIRQERKKKIGKTYKRFESIDSSNLQELPEGWTWVRLGEVCFLEYGKGLPKSKRIKGEIPVCGSNGIVGYHNNHYIKGPAIIIGRKGSFGKVNIVESDCWPIDTTYYITKDSVSLDFLFLYFLLVNLRLDEYDRSTAIPGLNREEAHSKVFALSPVQEQVEIVKRIIKFYKQADAAEKSIKIAQTHCDKLSQSIPTKAFRGELVKQDPNEESAGELLKRMKNGKKVQEN